MVKNIGGKKLWRIWRITSNLPKFFLPKFFSPIFTVFNRIVYGFRLLADKGSATRLKSHTGCQKSCEIFESQLILKSRFSIYLLLQIRKSSITGVDQWLDTTCVGRTVLYVAKTVDFACTEG